MAESCSICRYWKANFAGYQPIENAVGCCRIRAPLARSGFERCVFPETIGSGWCGEYRSIEIDIDDFQRITANETLRRKLKEQFPDERTMPAV